MSVAASITFLCKTSIPEIKMRISLFRELYLQTCQWVRTITQPIHVGLTSNFALGVYLPPFRCFLSSSNSASILIFTLRCTFNPLTCWSGITRGRPALILRYEVPVGVDVASPNEIETKKRLTWTRQPTFDSLPDDSVEVVNIRAPTTPC